MVAAGQKVKRLVAFGGRSAKTFAQAAALRPLEAGRSEAHEVQGHLSQCTPSLARPLSTGWPLPRPRVNKGLSGIKESLSPPGGSGPSARVKNS